MQTLSWTMPGQQHLSMWHDIQLQMRWTRMPRAALLVSQDCTTWAKVALQLCMGGASVWQIMTHAQTVATMTRSEEPAYACSGQPC